MKNKFIKNDFVKFVGECNHDFFFDRNRMVVCDEMFEYEGKWRVPVLAMSQGQVVRYAFVSEDLQSISADKMCITDLTIDEIMEMMKQQQNRLHRSM